MGWFIQRLLSALLVIAVVVISVFLLIHLIPGDPVDVMLGETASVADRNAMRVAMGLDQPITTQLMNYLQGLVTLDLGDSLHNNESIATLIQQRLPATAWLTLCALLLALALAIPLGIASAVYRDQWIDRFAMFIALGGLSIPNFLLGPLLVLLFAILLKWLPVSGNEGVSHVILPALTLGLSMAAVLSRMVRSSLLESLGEDYVRTARAKGAKPLSVIWQHAMRNAWLPVITVIGAQLGALLGGAVVTEIVFDWPGLGSLMIDSIQKRDYPVVQACVLLISVSYVLVNTLTDMVYGLLDPRTRLGKPPGRAAG